VARCQIGRTSLWRMVRVLRRGATITDISRNRAVIIVHTRYILLSRHGSDLGSNGHDFIMQTFPQSSMSLFLCVNGTRSLSSRFRLLQPPPPTETRFLDCEIRSSDSSLRISHTRMAYKCHTVNKVEGTNLQGHMYGESSVNLNAKMHAWRQRTRPISQC
jgi:hypothetical protein